MILIVIFLTGIVAGFVDAIAGGGGMIMIPGLIFSGLPVATAIATNLVGKLLWEYFYH